ncbi:MFS transporter [Streptomyces sp. NPDC047097]|uniref:MFS transporter n=1 Tax=Streptomyces sp. NPDC047097 TaxID=3155260 RepID=UPI0033BFFFBD
MPSPEPPHLTSFHLALSPESPVLGPRRPSPALIPRTGPPPHRAPRAPSPRGSSYRRLFDTPGARAFTLANLPARLTAGMFSVSAVIMIAGAYGSYALAGAVTATGLTATALVAPFTARLADRHGQGRVAVPATALAVLGSLALLLCVHLRAPAWTLFAAYAATATTPNLGGMARARWARLHRDDPAARHTANAFEQAVDELCFMLGPVAAAFLCAALFPEAGTLTGAALLLTGTLLFAAQRTTEPPATRPAARSRTPLRSPGMPALLTVFLATGAVFGSLEVVTLAYAEGPAGGVVLALQAAGSCLAGLVYGRSRRGGGLTGCLVAMTALMCLPPLAVAATGSLPVLAAALLVAGAATAPTMVTGMTLVQKLTPSGQLNEGMTLAVTALLGGIAAGAAGGGRLVEHLGPATAYATPAGAAALALLLSLLSLRRPASRRAPRPPHPPGG